MKKVILFMWFGDEKPPYIQWTLENFRQMNPGWEIRYIEYSNEQLKNYQEQNDESLTRILKGKEYQNFSFMVDAYKCAYLDMHHDELIMYCDLDCFPIAPFDNFIYSKEDPQFCQMLGDVFCREKFIGGYDHRSILGTCTSWPPFRPLIKEDWWCLCNSGLVTFNQFLELHKSSVLDDTLIVQEGVFMNRCNIDQFL